MFHERFSTINLTYSGQQQFSYSTVDYLIFNSNCEAQRVSKTLENMLKIELEFEMYR
jgi:hypothetical protein